MAPQRRRLAGRRLLAALSTVAVVGTFSGSAVSGSAAVTTNDTINQVIDRQAPISRDAERSPLAEASASVTRTTSPLRRRPRRWPRRTWPRNWPSSRPRSLPRRRAAEQAAAEAARAAAERAAAEAAAAFAASRPPTSHPARSPPQRLTRRWPPRRHDRLWGYENMCISPGRQVLRVRHRRHGRHGETANTIIAAGQMNYDMTNIPLVPSSGTTGRGRQSLRPCGDVCRRQHGLQQRRSHRCAGRFRLAEPATGCGSGPIIGWSSARLPAATSSPRNRVGTEPFPRKFSSTVGTRHRRLTSKYACGWPVQLAP